MPYFIRNHNLQITPLNVKEVLSNKQPRAKREEKRAPEGALYERRSMKVNHNGDTFKIIFNRLEENFICPGLSKRRRATKCEIFVEESDGGRTLVTDGLAICSPFDHFCKETGRKVSLTKALQKAFAHRETRKVFWEEYAKQTKKDWYKSNKEKILRPNLRPLREGGFPPFDCDTGVVVQRMFQQGEEK